MNYIVRGILSGRLKAYGGRRAGPFSLGHTGIVDLKLILGVRITKPL